MPDNSLFGKIRACFSIKDKNKALLDKIKVRRNRNENEKIDLQRVCPRLALTLLPVIEYSNKIKWNNEKQTFTGGREYGAPDCLRCFKRKWDGMVRPCSENSGTSVALYGRTIEEWTGYRLFSPFYKKESTDWSTPQIERVVSIPVPCGWHTSWPVMRLSQKRRVNIRTVCRICNIIQVITIWVLWCFAVMGRHPFETGANGQFDSDSFFRKLVLPFSSGSRTDSFVGFRWLELSGDYW